MPSHWSDPLLEHYQEAIDAFTKKHHGAPPPRFWELSLSIEDVLVTMALNGIVQEIRIRPLSVNPLGTSVFLRYLLRARHRHDLISVETNAPLHASLPVEMRREEVLKSVVFRIHLQGWPRDPVTIKTGMSQWTIINSEGANILGTTPYPLVWENMRIEGRGVAPINLAEVETIQGAVPPTWNRELMEVTIDAPRKLPVQMPIIDGERLTGYLRRLGTGPVTLGLQYSGVSLPQKYHLYLFASAPVVEPTAQICLRQCVGTTATEIVSN